MTGGGGAALEPGDDAMWPPTNGVVPTAAAPGTAPPTNFACFAVAAAGGDDACAPDAAGMLARIAEVETALDLSDKIAVVEIGDATIARRDRPDPGSMLGPTLSIYFARGPFVVEVSSWDITQGPMESVAEAIDAVLVATP